MNWWWLIPIGIVIALAVIAFALFNGDDRGDD
jgi:ABC-type dipeptide/oligopeptide/nickel transport system permease subunit